MFPKLTYFLSGVIATLGVTVTVTDPATLENLVSFPKRLAAHFQPRKVSLIDQTTAKFYTEYHIRKALDFVKFIPESDKDDLASQVTDQCFEDMKETEWFSLEFPFSGYEPGSAKEVKKTRSTANSLDSIYSQIGQSVDNLPNIISFCTYRMGLTLGIFGVLTIKDKHDVENPRNNPLKEGTIRFGGYENQVLEGLDLEGLGKYEFTITPPRQ